MCIVSLQVVPLIEVISTSKARGQVEKWLLELEGLMISSIKKVCLLKCNVHVHVHLHVHVYVHVQYTQTDAMVHVLYMFYCIIVFIFIRLYIRTVYMY